MRTRSLWLGTAVLAGCGLLTQTRLPLHYDVSWLLLVGHRLLHGAVLGVDVVEINPPLFAYLSVPMAWVSEQAGGRDATALRIVTSLTLFAMLAVTWRALRAGWPEQVAQQLTLAATAALFVLPGEQFGQREHFVLAGMLPYAVVAAMRVKGVPVPRGMALIAGTLMAVAIAIKPFFGLAWCGLEAWHFVRGTGLPWRRPESLLALVGVLAYAALVPVLWPFYVVWLRLLASTYWSYHHVSFITAFLIWPWTPLAVLSWGLAILPMAQRRDPLTTSLAIVGAGSLAAAVSQAKGWENHYLPAAGFTLLLLVLLAWRDETGARGRLRLFAARVVGGVAGGLILIQTILLLLGRSGELEPAPNLRTWLQSHTHPGDTIAVLTGVPFTPVRMAASSKTVLATRFQNLWPLASLRSAGEHGPPAGSSAVETSLFNAIVADLSRNRPAVVAIRPKGGELPSLDLLAYFMRSASFRSLITAYDSVGTMDNYLIWQRPRAE